MIAALLFTAVLAPLVAAAGSFAAGWRRVTAWASVVAAGCILAAGIGLGVQIGSAQHFALGHLLRADATSAVMLILIGAVGLAATVAGVDYVERELADGTVERSDARRYATLVPVFLAAMAVAVEAEDLGVVWAAIEATTVVTAFLVGHHRTRRSLEATWKYVVTCSFGLAVAFLGAVLLYFAAVHAGATPADALNFDTLGRYAGRLDPAVTHLAVGLLLLGLGTKVGLVPFHTWLADAHSEAPAPVSALMSGVLLAVTLSAILRVRVVADAALGVDFTRACLLAQGIATLVVAVSLLVKQQDFKRMLAYSSLEQMGLLAVAAAAGTPAALAGVLLAVVAHGLAKAVLFVTAGHFQRAHGSTAVADVRGLLTTSPLAGTLFAVALVGLVGFPPFALFAGELSMARGLASAHLAVPLGVSLGLLAVGFVSLTRSGGGMLLGSPLPGAPSVHLGRTVATPLVLAAVAFAVLGVVGGPLPHLITTAATELAGRP